MSCKQTPKYTHPEPERTSSQRAINDMPAPGDDDADDDDKTAAKQFLLKSAARTLDSAFEGGLLIPISG